MALSESGLSAQGITPGPTISGPAGSRKPVKSKRGAAPKQSIRKGGIQNFYKSPRGRK